MNSVGGAAACIQPTAWTCRLCLARQRRLPTLRKQIHCGGFKVRGNINRRKRPVLLAATTAGGLGGAALALSDDIRHGYAATARAGMVATALGVCINE